MEELWKDFVEQGGTKVISFGKTEEKHWGVPITSTCPSLPMVIVKLKIQFADPTL